MSPTGPETILVTGESLVPESVVELLRENGFAVRRVPEEHLTESELDTALTGATGYIMGGEEEPTAENFKRATQLVVVALTGTDFRKLIPGWQEAFRQGIAVVNTEGTNARSVAEFAVLLMLATARPFVSRIPGPEGRPPSGAAEPGVELAGRRLGIVGAGRIGTTVAEVAHRGLGMTVAYHARRDEGRLDALGFPRLSLPELLATSDVVSLHRPGTAQGEAPFIGAAELALMRPGAVLVNVAHHSLVDPASLVEPLRQGRLRAASDGMGTGAAWAALAAIGPDRFLCFPQMAYNTLDANLRTSETAARAVCDVLAGRTSAHVNNPDFRGVRQQLGKA